MKKILRDTLMLASLMILSVFVISILWSGMTDEIGLVLRLFGLAFLISLISYFCDEALPAAILGSYLLKYVAVTVIVMLYGFIAGWFYPSNFWMAAIYVAVVYGLAYFVDCFQIRRDVQFVNDRLKARKEPDAKKE